MWCSLGLDGADDTFRLDAQLLRATLDRLLPTRPVHVLSTGRRLEVEYLLTWQVRHAAKLGDSGRALARDLQRALVQAVAAAAVGAGSAGSASSPLVVSVKDSGLEAHFDRLFQLITTIDGQADHVTWSSALVPPFVTLTVVFEAVSSHHLRGEPRFPRAPQAPLRVHI